MFKPRNPPQFTPRSSPDELPPEFQGDPDPRHRESLFGQFRTKTVNKPGTKPKPKAKPKSKDIQLAAARYPLVPVTALMEATGSTSELEKRCVYDIMNKPAKGPDGKPVKGSKERLSRAYAICRASLQKSGRIKKGGMTLTKKGGKVSGPKARQKDHATKITGFEKAVVAARKSK